MSSDRNSDTLLKMLPPHSHQRFFLIFSSLTLCLSEKKSVNSQQSISEMCKKRSQEHETQETTVDLHAADPRALDHTHTTNALDRKPRRKIGSPLLCCVPFKLHCSHAYMASARLRHQSARLAFAAFTAGARDSAADRSKQVAASLNSAAERDPTSQASPNPLSTSARMR